MKRILLLMCILFLTVIPPAQATVDLTYANFPYGTLTSQITSLSSTLQITLGPNAGTFPQSGTFRVLIFNASCTDPSSCSKREFIELTYSSGTTYTVVRRGSEITAPDLDAITTTQTIWDANSKIRHVISAGTLGEHKTNINAAIIDPTTTRGDILYRNASNVLDRFPLCGNGLAVGSDGTDLVCVNPSGSSGVASVFGRTGAVIADAADYSSFYLPFSWIGSGSVTTLGTISTGIWNATPLADSYIASANTWNAKAGTNSPTFTGTVSIPSPFTLGGTSVTVSGTKINYLTDVTSNLQAQLDGKLTGVTANRGLDLTGTTVGITACSNDGEVRTWTAANGWSNCVNPTTGATITFNQLRTGTNTLGGSMICGTGCALSATGTGAIFATGISGASALPNGTTVTTQTQGDGTTKAASCQYVDTGLSGKAATNQTMYIGTTAVNINRGSGSLALTGITSIDGTAANLSGTPALPTGTTLTASPSWPDNTTKIATTANVTSATTGMVTVNGTPTAGVLAKWHTSGNTIVDGLKYGTMTDAKWCTYTTADGLTCNADEPAGTGSGDFLADGTVPMTGQLDMVASTVDMPAFYMPVGTAPTSPQDGWFWRTLAGAFYQSGVSTIGPLGTAGEGISLYPPAGISVSPGIGGPWSDSITGTNCLAGFNGSGTAGCFSSGDWDFSTNKLRVTNSAGATPDNLGGSFVFDTTAKQVKISDGSVNHTFMPITATASSPSNYCGYVSGNVQCNLSASGYTLPAATATVLGGVKGTAGSLLCTGTNKVRGLNSDGSLSCDTDQTISPSLTSAYFWVGNASNVPTEVAMSGDVALSNTGATTVNAIKNSAVPTLSTGNLRYNGSAFIFDSTAYAQTGVDINSSHQVTATHLAAPLPASQGGTGVANNSASTLTISGNYATTLTVTGVTGVTLPTTGTLATTSQLDAKANLAGPTFTGTVSGLLSGTTNNCVKIGASGTLVDAGAACGSGEGMTYPAAGIPVSTGSAWSTSLTTIPPDKGGTGVANNAASTLTISGNYATTLTVTGATGVTLPTTGTLATRAGAETLTNKRITSRVFSEASNATPDPDADAYDQHNITALAADATVSAPTGTPTDGQKMIFRIKDNGTARALAWNAAYRASTDIALPTTTTISKTLYCGFIWNSTDSKWDLLAVTNGF